MRKELIERKKKGRRKESISGESFEMKFIPNELKIFRIIPEFVSGTNSFIPL